MPGPPPQRRDEPPKVHAADARRRRRHPIARVPRRHPRLPLAQPDRGPRRRHRSARRTTSTPSPRVAEQAAVHLQPGEPLFVNVPAAKARVARTRMASSRTTRRCRSPIRAPTSRRTFRRPIAPSRPSTASASTSAARCRSCATRASGSSASATDQVHGHRREARRAGSARPRPLQRPRREWRLHDRHARGSSRGRRRARSRSTTGRRPRCSTAPADRCD